MNLTQRIISRVASAVPANGALRLDNGPLCSFTFDDVPRSALLTAGKMLEDAGAAGTYYVAGSIAKEPDHKEMARLEDLPSLLAHGHELGCHTFTHTSVVGRSTRELEEDFASNARTICEASGIESLTSFSYPFGEVSFRAKRLCATKFAACRGVRSGLNHRFMDMSELRAISIYHHDYSLQRFKKIIDICKRRSAWVIFYTHDVRSNPSRWGCTEQEFANVLDAVVKAGIEIMTVKAAVGRTMFRRAMATSN
jgi:peptidoglycan/xylan/chitin deacetylase (PgdA/CDA1 family)